MGPWAYMAKMRVVVVVMAMVPRMKCIGGHVSLTRDGSGGNASLTRDGSGGNGSLMRDSGGG